MTTCEDCDQGASVLMADVEGAGACEACGCFIAEDEQYHADSEGCGWHHDSELCLSLQRPDPPKSFADACTRQKALWIRFENGESIPNIREASMKKGYRVMAVPHHGMGRFSVRPDGSVCESEPIWGGGVEAEDDGDVLLCSECYRDGT